MEAAAPPAEALITRHFTTGERHPFDTVNWVRRDARAGDFFQEAVECPDFWSEDSIGVVAKLYFATVGGVREDSVRQMIDRVARKITVEGVRQGHFGVPPAPDGSDKAIESYFLERDLDSQARIFYEELCYISLYQYAGFNTPTWLNIGVPGRRQCGHACYPLSVKDVMLEPGGSEGFGITNWWDKESIIFKAGGGSGINLSNLRGSMEPLSTGGTASGPVAYIRPSNAGAETLKSGGAHRRAAKFICLDDNHPDIFDFIDSKVREDHRMHVLAEHADEDFSTFTAVGERNIAEVTSFQSANHSVCTTDAFMKMATQIDSTAPWELRARVSGEVVDVVDARKMLRTIAEAAWRCGDPGLIFIDTINAWHTTPSLGPVTTTNTCGEVTQNDDTACNLAALNVLKFFTFQEHDGSIVASFDVNHFRHTVDVITIAMDIVCGFSELPTELIEQNTRDLRQLGMGFTNFGAAVMAQGYPYDSDEGRAFGAAITALLTGRVYAMSSRLAEKLGPFARFEENRETMLDVIDKHMSFLPEDNIFERSVTRILWESAISDWAVAAARGQEHGYRNALATAMMPTGTVSFLLGADTTGVEPGLSLVTTKKLAAAGEMKLVNRSAHLALRALGYARQTVDIAESELRDLGVEAFMRHIRPEHHAVFATAMGSNFVEPMGHVRMVAAMQPFVSQAISKTTNLPHETTVEEIEQIYVEAWRMDVKVLSVYRDGSKATQVLKAVEKPEEKLATGGMVSVGLGDLELRSRETLIVSEADVSPPRTRAIDEEIEAQVSPRARMPRTRQSITHKIHIRTETGDHEGYITAGMYPDGRLGEIFLEGFGKFGGFTQDALSAWATDASIGMQYGMPMEVWCRKHAFVSDETGGIVVPVEGEPVWFRRCSSIIDYIARWIAGQFGDDDLCEELGVMTDAVKVRKSAALGGSAVTVVADVKDGEITNGAVLVQSTPFIEGLEPFKLSSNGHGRHIEAGPPCNQCGATMYRAGACWQCSCGNHTGCG